MNSFQKAALQATTETITEESFETGLTVGHGTSVQHFAIKPLPASSQQVASKCWSKSCKASLVWEFSSAELTVTALAWHCTSANLNLDLAKTPECNALGTQPKAEKVTQIQPLPEQEDYDPLVAMPRPCIRSILARVC